MVLFDISSTSAAGGERTEMTLASFPNVIAHPKDPSKQLDLCGFVANLGPLDCDDKAHYVAMCRRNPQEWRQYNDVTSSRAKNPRYTPKVFQSTSKVKFYPEVVVYAEAKKV